MKLSNFSLSARIIIGTLLAVIASVAALMYVENARIRDVYLSEQQAHLEKALDVEELRLRQTINTLRQDVLFLSNAPPVSGIVRTALNHGYDPRYGNTHQVWAERLQQIFSAFSTAHPSYYKIRFIGVADGGREIVRIDNRGGKIEVTPPDRLQAKGDRDYYKATLGLREGQVYLSEFNLNREWGVIEQPYWPTLRATTPIFTPSGEIFGMVMISIDAKSLLKPSVLSLPQGIQAYITNSDGQYLLHPDPQRAFMFELGGKDNITTDIPYLKMLFNPQAAGYRPMQAVATSAGSQYLAAKRVYFDSGNPSRFLVLAYAVPGAVVAQKILIMPLKSFVGGFVIILLISAAALYVLRRTFAPLEAITKAADRIAAGEQNVRLPYAGGGEIGSLTHAISAMLFSLSQREHEIMRLNAGLEERVRERTKELEQAQTETGTLLRRYRTLMLTSMDGVHIMDMQGNAVEANDAFCNMLGYTREEVIGLNVADWEAQYSVEELRKGFKNLSGKSVMFETMHRRKDGALINVELSVNGVEMEGMGIVFATSRDITERKRIEIEILRVNTQLQATMDALPDLLFEVGLDGWIYSQHIPRTDSLAAFPANHLGKTIFEALPQDAAKTCMSALQEASERGRSTGKEIALYLPSGERWFELSVASKGGSGSQGRRFIVLSRDITDRRKAEEEIHNLAFYDALTKLPNRRLFLDRFSTALNASVRHNNYGAVLFIDLDRFKLLNDTLGHDYGDLLLIEVAVRIKACVREVDTVARLGGDEFVVLIESISDDQEEASYKTGLVAEKIRESLAVPYNLNVHEHHSSPSIGVSLFRDNVETVEKLLQHADMAMYQAKESGRNTVRFFDSAMQHNVAMRAELLKDLHSAIALQQLHLHYQLQLDTDNHPVGAEALLRWVHPQRGMVMPEQFLPIAEGSALILDIDDWVLNTACRQLALWGAKKNMRDFVLTVNISTKQFAVPDFVDKVARTLRLHQINPACLKLELTEDMVLNDLPGAVEKMHALKALGVCLSMDDFGTRYSSLASLKQLPLDQLKLGRSFVRDIARDGNVALLVQSIIDLSNKYLINVVAEGVESEAQLALLKDRDCVAYQGFLFSKAVSIEEFEQLLDRG